MDVREYLKKQKQRVEEYIRDYLDSRDDIPSGLREAMEYSLFAGGKRVRPILALAVCEAVSGDETAALAGGCAVEMIHTYSLIHDDLPSMDNDDLRRGRPTSHIRFGEADAILAGDGLQAMAFELIFSRIADPRTALLTAQTAARAAGPGGMVGGQHLDMKFENTPCSEEELRELHSKKTGAILKASVLIGAYSGSCPEAELEALDRFGSSLGLLFQVVDDILDEEGDQEKMGKTLGKDEAALKSTFVRIRGLEGAREYRDTLYKNCLNALEIMNGRDTILRELAGFIAYRDH